MTNTLYNWNDCKPYGDIGEGQNSHWLRKWQGWNLLPAYEIEYHSGKGPRLLTADGRELISPDFLGMKYQKRKFILKWFEAKHKTRFSWHWKSQNWQTGIDIKHYHDYIEVQKETIEVFVLFLHSHSQPSQSDLEHGCPPTCPTGLFGRPLSYLMEHVHHEDKYPRGNRQYPMMYWNANDLEKLATLEEMRTFPVSLWKGNGV